ncbi:stimulator of interferon genes protein-like [Aricia agestis]|uniref:stimulator of interferon genes protein-like n=1 Tax=Aricia agestis TaxID=91739 RepID=UPI001C2020E8|nr:stimulator of interferon genes protein-like [Aricia agestis]
MSQELEKAFIFTSEVLFAGGILYGSQILHGGLEKGAAVVARYIIYLLLMRGARETLTIIYRWRQRPPKYTEVYLRNKPYFALFALAAGVCALSNKVDSLTEEFVFLLLATLAIRYIDMHQTGHITYGVGMACSFMEGYLEHVLPSNGADFVGIEENIRRYESRHGVVFPVKGLILVITRSLYCPPDLKEFNKSDPKMAYMEACESLGEVEKDVAGVKRRVYRNSVYKIHRGSAGGRPVYVTAECATPLHTLYRVLQKRAVYEDLLKSISPHEISSEFCEALRSIVARSPARGRCHLVYIDDTDPTQNLADVLLEAIRRIELNFNVSPQTRRDVEYEDL